MTAISMIIKLAILSLCCLAVKSETKKIQFLLQSSKYGAPVGTVLEIDEGTGLYKPFKSNNNHAGKPEYSAQSKNKWHHYCRSEEAREFFKPAKGAWCMKEVVLSESFWLNKLGIYNADQVYQSVCCDGNKCVCEAPYPGHNCKCVTPSEAAGQYAHWIQADRG